MYELWAAIRGGGKIELTFPGDGLKQFLVLVRTEWRKFHQANLRYEPICARYERFGTDMAVSAMFLCACYRMPSTETAISAMRLRAPYEMPGTDATF